MDEKYIKQVKRLREKLHTCPELAFEETETKNQILSFLKEHTKLEVVEQDKWIYAKWDGKGSRQNVPEAHNRTLAFRADYDAVRGADDLPGHFCGHDGHAAILCGLASYISDIKPHETIYLIFQPAEETGQGAAICSPYLKEWQVEEIYGFHNIPGYPLGEILLLEDTFACASTGLEITLTGTPSHAAYPEDGLNPAFVISEIILFMKAKMEEERKGMVLGTVIGVDLGSDAYGVSADQGVLRLTIRGQYQEEFDQFLKDIVDYAKEKATEEGFAIHMQEIERFPATENHRECVHFLEKCAQEKALVSRRVDKPFRWSEDFGYYLMETKGAFFGVGDGENHPQLHTVDYEFPDEIIPYVLKMYQAILD